NTDNIQILMGDGDDAITIDQTDGTFVQPNGNEVQINIDGGPGDHDNFMLYGTPGNDVIDIGMTADTPAFNLNGDVDIDVIVTSAEEFRIFGQAGDDTLNAGGSSVVGDPFATAVALFGGDGNDTTIGGAYVSSHIGGAGNDTMIG